jgi:murein L,D-transpeptidase YafK
MWDAKSWRRKGLSETRLGIVVGLIALALALACLSVWHFWPTKPKPPSTAMADLVVVHKAARRLELYRGGVLLRSFAVSLGPHPKGPKQQEGDGRTPEGEYRIDYRKPDSAFYRALHISYPGPADVAAARSRGVSPGGLVMIHGEKNGLSPQQAARLPADWTDGCIAVTDREMDEIWRAVPDGTKIIITP